MLSSTEAVISFGPMCSPKIPKGSINLFEAFAFVVELVEVL